jgi:very-short-patch-repair endonuclease
MVFGPISSEGGERRLNVLFTRARARCEVFASFGSGDINLERATGAGPRVLKRFLQFAETGVLEEATPTGADFDSPFEANVAAAIESLGYRVETQIGSAGFRIDLAVRDPAKPGRFILAIECDGAIYHSALWARERDRLRQEVLEGLGWRVHRIWSTDWFYRRDEQVRKLKAALEAARGDIEKPDAIAASTKRNGAPKRRPEDGGAKQTTKRPKNARQSEKKESFSKSVKSGSIRSEKPFDVPRLQPYVLAECEAPRGEKIEGIGAQRLGGMVQEVIGQEGPIRQDEIVRRVESSFGRGAGRAAAPLRSSPTPWTFWRRKCPNFAAKRDFGLPIGKTARPSFAAGPARRPDCGNPT